MIRIRDCQHSVETTTLAYKRNPDRCVTCHYGETAQALLRLDKKTLPLRKYVVTRVRDSKGTFLPQKESK